MTNAAVEDLDLDVVFEWIAASKVEWRERFFGGVCAVRFHLHSALDENRRIAGGGTAQVFRQLRAKRFF